MQTAFLGDVALAMPLCGAIKDIFPQSRLTFITTKQAAPIAKLTTAIDNVLIFDKRGEHKGLSGLYRFAVNLRLEKFDIFLSLHRSLRSAILSKLSSPKYSYGFNTASGAFLYNFRCKYQLHQHEITRNLNFLKLLNKQVNLSGYDKSHVNLKFNQELVDTVNTKLDKLKITTDKIILLAPNSVWETKKWTQGGFIKVAREMIGRDYNVLLIGSKDDYDYTQIISHESRAFNICGEFSIPETIYLMTKVKLLVSNDSAPVHFAGLVNCPVVAIFGPTSPIFGFAPRSLNSIIVERSDLKCKPCEIHGSNRCPIGTFECMKSLSHKEVIMAIDSILNRHQVQ